LSAARKCAGTARIVIRTSSESQAQMSTPVAAHQGGFSIPSAQTSEALLCTDRIEINRGRGTVLGLGRGAHNLVASSSVSISCSKSGQTLVCFLNSYLLVYAIIAFSARRW
jgi:hypothetical protein